jgi:hypothetical protein
MIEVLAVCSCTHCHAWLIAIRQVQPPKQAVCYDGDALLGQFGTPYPADAEVVASKYPWLESFGAGACPKDRLPKDGWQTVASQKDQAKGFFRRWVH